MCGQQRCNSTVTNADCVWCVVCGVQERGRTQDEHEAAELVELLLQRLLLVEVVGHQHREVVARIDVAEFLRAVRCTRDAIRAADPSERRSARRSASVRIEIVLNESQVMRRKRAGQKKRNGGRQDLYDEAKDRKRRSQTPVAHLKILELKGDVASEGLGEELVLVQRRRGEILGHVPNAGR